QKLAEDWTGLRSRFRTSVDLPPTCSRAAIEASRTNWDVRCQQAERERTVAREWVAGLEQARRGFPAQLSRLVNVVASQPRTLASDPHFGDTSGATFDVLVIDEADLLTEADFLQGARRARRWILMGEMAPDAEVSGTRAPRTVRPN